MRWNKPNRHLPGVVVVVASCKDNIFNILMGFGTLKQKVWTLMARWILGLTRFSACLLWRLGLTQAKLEESTSCTPSCYGTNLTFAMLTRGLQRPGCIGIELSRPSSESDAMRCLQPAVFCIFEADAGQVRSLTSPRFQVSRKQDLTWADCACSRSRNSPISNRHSSQKQSV